MSKSFSLLWNPIRILLYVKWEGYPGKFNNYVFQDEIES